MENLVTVATFTYPSDVAIIRGKLESEGVECFTKDETTVQIHNFYSNAVGGIKLQVPKDQAPKAIEILKEAGHLKEEDFQPSTFWTQFERWTKWIPWIDRIRVELRFMLLTTLIVLLGLLVGYLVTIPSTKEYLTENFWCVSKLTYKGKEYAGGSCSPLIDFSKDGSFTLSGLKAGLISGEWSLQGEDLRITRIDTLKWVYKGQYELEPDGRKMTLNSDRTKLECHKKPFQ